MPTDTQREPSREELEACGEEIQELVGRVGYTLGRGAALDVRRALIIAIAERVREAEAVTVDRKAPCAGLPPVMYNAIMDAIEQTIAVCDDHEKQRIPLEMRVVDYADILVSAVETAQSTLAVLAATTKVRPMPDSMPSLIQQRIEAEREAEDARPTHASHCICDRCMATDAETGRARAATDEAVKAVDRDARQARVAAWTVETFGPDSLSIPERAARFIEEAIELVQACGFDREAIDRLIARAYAKSAGDPASELGNVGLTLLGLAAALNVSADDAERRDVERVEALPPEHWHKRHAAKAAAGLVFDWPITTGGASDE